MAEKNNANIGFEKQIWDAACELWGHIPAADYRKVIVGLIFLRYISCAFERKFQALLAEGEGFENDRDEYLADNIFFVPEKARWSAVAAAALTAGIDPAATVNCTGRYWFYSGYQPGCLQYGHGGPVDLRTALEYSCNIFFYDVGRRLGVDVFSAMARQLGLATPTGVEIAEAQGRLTWSSDENYQAGLTLMAAIGQGNTAVTPLQLAAYAATLANCGQRPALHFADRAVNAATGETVWQYAPTFTTVPGGEGVFGPIRDGMKRMARTTRVLREAPVACAAKTGSPQLADTLPGGGHYVNSVLIGYAPADDPQIAMAVVLEYGGGGSNAAPILRAVLDAVFGV